MGVWSDGLHPFFIKNRMDGAGKNLLPKLHYIDENGRKMTVKRIKLYFGTVKKG